MIENPAGVVAVLAGIATLFFTLEKRFRWKLFTVFPPLLFIYAIPVITTNLGLTPAKNPAYDALKLYALPAFLVLMLIDIDVKSAVRVMGKGVIVMLIASVGVVVGGVVAYAAVHRYMEPEAWRTFGTLAGSWIGGTGNMAAVAGALKVDEQGAGFGLAVLADNLVYVVWLPILLGSKAYAKAFARFTKVDPERVAQMEKAAAEIETKSSDVKMLDLLTLTFIAAACVWIAGAVSEVLPPLEPVVSRGTWKVLLVTTLGIGLSFTPVRRIPGTHAIAMAIVYVFVAGMGARSSIDNLGDAPAFLAGAYLWIFIHGAFCLVAARIFRVDVATAAIASAANIGGAASAPIVAAHHNEALVPVSILMALIGYAIGNFLAVGMAQLCLMIT
ncbi:MAG: DUF819 family protein [Deltaproteobacteria bacterium]|jgi:uncharacterized membrane protein